MVVVKLVFPSCLYMLEHSFWDMQTSQSIFLTIECLKIYEIC